MTFGKRQLLVGALVVALGAAVYLNWQFTNTQPVAVSETAADTKELGQTVYVNTEVSGQTAKKAENSQPAEKSSKNTQTKAASAAVSSAQMDFFTSERQQRQSARDDAVSALAELIEAADTSEQARKEAMAAAEALSKNIKAESDMETEIKAKGFADCLVSVNNGNCTVIVPEDGLNEATVVTIKDIVNRQSGIDFDKITITGQKK